MASTYLGLDLAWSPRKRTGLAALAPTPRGLRVFALGTCSTDDEIVAFVRAHLAETTVVMVDAPLVIPNVDGMRACDELTYRRFGAYDAGTYPANRTNVGRYAGGRPRGEVLLERLAPLGFHVRDPLPSGVRASGRWVLECYRHPAQLLLFGLGKTLKYKCKGQGLAVARAELARYLDHVRALRAPRLLLSHALLRSLDGSDASGEQYREIEDRIDALFCAYLAALLPEGRLALLGRPAEGSVALPIPHRDTGRTTALEPCAPPPVQAAS